MDIPTKIEARVGDTHVEFYLNKPRIGNLIAIGITLLWEAATAGLYLMYSQPGTFEPDLRLGTVAFLGVIGAIPGAIAVWDLIRPSQ